MFTRTKSARSAAPSRPIASTPAERPYWVTELELTAPPLRLAAHRPPHGDRPYRAARILIRLQGEPLGQVEVGLTESEASVGEIMELAIERFGPAVAERLGGGDPRDLLASSTTTVAPELAAIAGSAAPPVTVVIGTRNRPEHIVMCIDHLLKQSYDGPVEIIVVDNAPSSSATADAIVDRYGEHPQVRYLLEDRKGLSWARNLGLRHASHDIVAFLSDDIRVDSLWLRAIVRGFGRTDEVGSVVGFCPPLYLDTEEQLVFERTMAWGWRNGFEPSLARAETRGDRLAPYRVGFGNGANIAFKADLLRSLGGFDVCLGPGTKARGGEDLDAFTRTLLAGATVAWEPAALGWHADRYDDRTFTAHMYTYGLGLTAYLTAHAADPATRWTLLKRIPFGAPYLFRPAVLPVSEDRLTVDAGRVVYRLANAVGRLAGPFAYGQSKRHTRRTTR